MACDTFTCNAFDAHKLYDRCTDTHTTDDAYGHGLRMEHGTVHGKGTRALFHCVVSCCALNVRLMLSVWRHDEWEYIESYGCYLRLSRHFSNRRIEMVHNKLHEFKRLEYIAVAEAVEFFQSTAEWQICICALAQYKKEKHREVAIVITMTSLDYNTCFTICFCSLSLSLSLCPRIARWCESTIIYAWIWIHSDDEIHLFSLQRLWPQMTRTTNDEWRLNREKISIRYQRQNAQ